MVETDLEKHFGAVRAEHDDRDAPSRPPLVFRVGIIAPLLPVAQLAITE